MRSLVCHDPRPARKAGPARLLALATLATLAVMAPACDKRPAGPPTYAVRKPAPAKSAPPPAAVSAPTSVSASSPAPSATATDNKNQAGDPALPDPKADPIYLSFVRATLAKHGCDSGPCHGMVKGGGLYFVSALPNVPRDYQAVLERLDRQHPEKSPLLMKALGQVPHVGGKNLSDNECDTRRLLAWIGKRPDPACQPRPKPSEEERFAREVAPALRALGCASDCHGQPGGAAARRLDLTATNTALWYPSFLKTDINRNVAWLSGVIKAAWGETAAHPKAVDLTSCAYRRLHGFVVESPESTCALDQKEAGPSKSMDDFVKIVMPSLSRRGCVDVSCHGSSTNLMKLFDPDRDKHAPLTDYLALTARIEDPQHPDKSTFLRTVRNQEPHGGGKRLGGKGDCLDDMLTEWLAGRPVKACPKPEPPSKERFVSEIQAVVDKMTCSQARCHGGSLPLVFTFMPHATDPAVLEANYQAFIKKIDYDFMPFSPVMLRMREPCAYGVVGAWIEGRPRPKCVVHDPDPGMFPKLEKKLLENNNTPPPPPKNVPS